MYPFLLKTCLLEDKLFLKSIKTFQNASSRGWVISKWDLIGDGHKQTNVKQK